MIKVLMISTDAKILEEGSAVRARMKEYGRLFTELHIVVFAKKSLGFRRSSSGNVFVYPTNSVSKAFYTPDAIHLGKAIVLAASLRADDSVITTQDPFETGVVGKTLSKKSSIPLHIQIHTDFLHPNFARGSIVNRLRLAMSRMTLPHAKAIRAVSERVKRSIYESDAYDIGAAVVSVLPIFTDISVIKSSSVPASFRDWRDGYDKVALMASRFTDEKGIDTAIAAFTRVVLAYPRAALVLIGAGTGEEGLRAQAKALGLEKSIVFEPWADRATLIAHLKTADVFVSASHYEGYGLSMLEAHIAGAEVVATDAGIAPDLTDAICPVGDVDCLASKIISAFGGEKSRKEFAYRYPSKESYLEEYKRDIERALQ